MFVFVYGTLKRDGCRAAHLSGAHYCGLARTQRGYRLFDLGEYPGLIEDAAGGCIEGELYRVSGEQLARLDIVEGVAEGWYDRRPVRLRSPHSDVRAEAWFFLGGVAGRRELVGRWTNPSPG
ncbi:MAG: gamma-glutamylcyclotransferase [Planctomyces sp.]|nr:gamma-glutamylcyclotransferase [Planctomyces sp.]